MDGQKARTGVQGGVNEPPSSSTLRRGLEIPRQGRRVMPRDAVLDGAPFAPTDDIPLTHELTVIVPTRNESGNVEPLLNRLSRTLEGRQACVIFVDDSDDDTPQRVHQAGKTSPLTVRLHHREPHERTGGLGGAVLAGLRQTNSPWAVVMDGDLQHPPELVPELIAAGVRDNADVVVASRHVPGGSTAGLANGVRVLVSDLSTHLSKAFFPRRLKGISDPMSGFFAIRPNALELEVMRPPGFKILLEMVARTPGLAKSEVPFVFGERLSGDSKASLKEGFRFLRQLLQLFASQLFTGRRSSAWGRGLGFATVGATGLFVNLALMWLLADPTTLAINYAIAAILATQLSSTWNFLLTDTVVYRGPKRLTPLIRWLGFMGMSNLILLLRLPLLALFISVLGMHYLIATALTLLLGFVVRFKSQERLTIKEQA